MDIKNKAELLAFRLEYEQSGLSRSEFASIKGMEYWKSTYALRKALTYQAKRNKAKVGFKPIVVKQEDLPKQRFLTIKTSYGSEINIPL